MYILKYIKNEQNSFDHSTITFEIDGELVLDDMMQQIRLFLIASGYGDKNVSEYIEAK
jgi:predicted component of type VI protein secretion system